MHAGSAVATNAGYCAPTVAVDSYYDTHCNDTEYGFFDLMQHEGVAYGNALYVGSAVRYAVPDGACDTVPDCAEPFATLETGHARRLAEMQSWFARDSPRDTNFVDYHNNDLELVSRDFGTMRVSPSRNTPTFCAK
jgi:hypothetical protein